MSLSIAVVGAGVAGLSCARVLAEAGVQVTIFEQARALGGRLATRRTELGGFDVGAQYFTREGSAFGAAVDQWVAAGVCAPWAARLTQLPGGGASAHTREMFVGTPAMATLAGHLARGLDVRAEQRIRRLEALGHGRPMRWTLMRAADASDTHSIEITEGIFDAVVVAAPPPAALALLEQSAELEQAARAARFASCYALLLGFPGPLDLPYDAAHVDGHRLAWIARDSGKPERRPGERWVAHASWAWSREHASDDPEDVRAKLVKAFAETTGTREQPIYSAISCWSYAAPERAGPSPTPFLWDQEKRLGACGDWLAGARVESAWLSGTAVAAAALASLGRPA